MRGAISLEYMCIILQYYTVCKRTQLSSKKHRSFQSEKHRIAVNQVNTAIDFLP